MSTETEPTTGDGKSEPRKCRAHKVGRVDLNCTELEGHDRPAKGEGTWHRAVCRSRQEITYDGGRHVIEQAETVEWEPLDHVGEATRHLMAGRKGDS